MIERHERNPSADRAGAHASARLINSLHVTVDASLNNIKPGQSVLARISEEWTPYLREQWWPVAQQKNTLIFEQTWLPASTSRARLSALIGLVGEPFRFRRTLRNVLLIAYKAEPDAAAADDPGAAGESASA
jgi:hypothetical protein